MKNLNEKKEMLLEKMRQLTAKDLMVAFSGGVDSSLLLKLACLQAEKSGSKVYAVMIRTMLHPKKEQTEARREALNMGAEFLTVDADELGKAGIEDNPVNRCYLCKKYMFTKVLELAAERNISVVVDGTNGDDSKEYRPGIQALIELGIKSPLMELEITKQEVRQMAREYGVSASDKPSSPCMATRFPYNTRLSYEELKKTEKIEAFLKQKQFYNVRARIHGNLVRIEVDREDIPKLIDMREELLSEVKSLGYLYVTMDMEGFRSGSQDENLLKNK